MQYFNHSLKFAILAASISFFQPAMAIDGKVYAGSMCQKELGNGSYGGGTFRNDSTTGSVTVSCPLVRDVVNGSIQDAHVRLYSATSGSFCTLNLKSYFGNAGFVQFKFPTNNTGFQNLNFTSLPQANNRPYYIWCAISPSTNANKSRIIGYRLDEQ